MHKQKTLLFIIVAGLVFSLFINLNVVELRAEEPRRAVVAMEMYILDDYIVPHLNGWFYYNKPPLFNWLLIALYKIFGSFDEWVVRLPSIISFLAMGWLTRAIVQRYINREVAVLSALFFLTSADLLFYGTATGCEIDIFYSLLVMLQVLCLFHFYQKQRFALMFVLSYLFAALGVLTKGVPSVVFQVLTMFALLWQHKKLKLLFSWQHVAGIALFGAIVGGYFYVYSLRGNLEHFAIKLLKEASQKSGLEASPMETIKKTFLFPLDLIKYLLPWSLLVIFLFNQEQVRLLWKNPLIKFLALFIVVNIPVYWITAQSRSRYIYMFFPFICTILAYAYVNAGPRFTVAQRVVKIVLLIFMILLCVVFAVIPFVPQTSGFALSSTTLFAAMLLLLYFYKKWKESRLYLVVLAIVFARIGMALIYFPLYQVKSSSLIYREHTANILKVTGTNPVHFFGIRNELSASLSVGSIRFLEGKIVTPIGMPYQLPYYITKVNHHVVQFTQEIEAGRYYLAYEKEIGGFKADVLYKFREKATNNDIVLIIGKDNYRQMEFRSDQ